MIFIHYMFSLAFDNRYKIYILWLCYPVQLLVIVWTVAHQTTLSMGFFRQEYYSGLLFPPPGYLLNPGTEPTSLALAVEFFTTEPPRKSIYYGFNCHFILSMFTPSPFLGPLLEVSLSFKIYLFIWLHWVFTAACGMFIPGPGIKPGPFELGVWSLSQQTTREVPHYLYYNDLYSRILSDFGMWGIPWSMLVK